MVDLLTIDTGEIMQWADTMDNRGADFAAEVLKKVKKRHERQRKGRKIRFSKIRRRKSGTKRFAIVKDPNRAAELIDKSTSDHFYDIFREK
jgi:hypothetical protein